MTEPREPELITVPVQGGELAVLRWAPDTADAPVAVLVHGITANAMAWARVAGALAGDFEILAPDLRGRGGSSRLPGPYGLDQHVADLAGLLARVAEARGGRPPRTVLVGHSMGAFVATLAAAGPLRDRVHGLVLVDGGAALPVPPGADVDAMLAAVLGPSLDRLSMTFPDLAAVRAFWTKHPAVGPWVDVPSVAAYLARDITGTEPALHSSCVPAAVRTDGADVLLNERVLEALDRLPVPATLLWTPRGLLDQTPGLYDEQRLAQLGLERWGITAAQVPDTNHYSVLWAAPGIEAIGTAVRETAAGVR